MPSPETLYNLAFGDRTLALTAEELEKGLKRGLALTGGTAAAAPPNGDARLWTAEAMEEHTGVPHGWFLEAARRREIPHHRIGRYVRFDLAEVRDSTRFRGRAAP